MISDTATINLEAPLKTQRIGELLVGKGVISGDQVRIALTEQNRTREHLGRILVRLGFATEAVISDVLGGKTLADFALGQALEACVIAE